MTPRTDAARRLPSAVLMASSTTSAALPCSPRSLITVVAKSELPEDRKPTTAISTRSSGNSDRKAASAIDDDKGPPPMAPKRSWTDSTWSSHGHRRRHRSRSNTGGRYPRD